MADKHEIDEITGTGTTGHEWDGIRELDTPLPRWWLWTFYVTIVWGIAYTIAYPAWPLINDATRGVLGYSTRGAFDEAVAENAARQQVFVDRVAALDLEAIAADPELAQFTQSGGAAIFRNYCSQCHGAGAAGVQAAGYPNLLDDDWLWGGSREEILTTVAHGIRFADDDDTHSSEMPAFGRDGILSKAEIEAVADHVLSLSSEADANAEGAALFADNCAACHGAEARGDTSLGAPDLADRIWLYGADRARVIESIAQSRSGVMPGWAGRLSDQQIKQVTLYVHGLGGGQ